MIKMKKVIIITSIFISVSLVLSIFPFLFLKSFVKGNEFVKFSQKQIAILEDFYHLDFPEDTKFVWFRYDIARDNYAGLIIEYPHDKFTEFMENKDHVYTDGYGADVLQLGKDNVTIETAYASSDLETTISYTVTENGTERIELYTTRAFSLYKQFEKAK